MTFERVRAKGAKVDHLTAVGSDETLCWLKRSFAAGWRCVDWEGMKRKRLCYRCRRRAEPILAELPLLLDDNYQPDD